MDSLRQTTKYHPPAIKEWHSYFSDNLILLWERRCNFRFLIVMNFRGKKSILIISVSLVVRAFLMAVCWTCKHRTKI